MKNRVSSAYLSPVDAQTKKSAISFVRLAFSAVIALVVGTFFMGSAVAVQEAKKAEALDWTQWILCNVAPDPSKEIYQISQTSDLQYQLRSKSTMNGEIAEVNHGLNWILNLFGPGYD